MRVVLINPNLLVLPRDPFATGVVRLPLGLASVAAALREDGVGVTVLDAYARSPRQGWVEEPYLVFGLDHAELAGRVPPDTDLVLLHAHHAAQLHVLPGILRALQQAHPDLPVVVLENAHAQPAFLLEPHADLLVEAGADAVLCGEAEQSAVQVARALDEQTVSMHHVPGLRGAGLANRPGAAPDLDGLPTPAWDLFPLATYWRGRLAYGPFGTGRYLPLQFSRGTRRAGGLTLRSASSPPAWRRVSPARAVAEIAVLRERYRVREFHVEDLAPNLGEAWVGEFCDLLAARPWSVEWKFVNPCPPSAFSEGVLRRMAGAGCRYLAFGVDARPAAAATWFGASRRVREMSRVGIRSLACLDLGLAEPDRPLLRQLVGDLARCGLDELDLTSPSAPRGQADPLVQGSAEHELARLRGELSGHFLGRKLWHHPGKVVRQGVNLLLRRFETRSEMSAYQAGVHRWRALGVRRPEESAPAAPAALAEESEPEPATRRAA